MIHMTHHSHDRRTLFEILLVILHSLDSLRDIGAHKLCSESEFLCHDIDCLSIETLVDGYHHAKIHTCGNDVVDGHIHHVCKVVGSDKLRDLDHAALCCLALLVFELAVVHLLAFLLTPFHALLGGLVGETCKGLLHLLLHIFSIHLRLCLTAIIAVAASIASAAVVVIAIVAAAVVVIAVGATIIIVAASAIVAIIAAAVAATLFLAVFRSESGLRSCLLDIHFLFSDTLAFLAVGIISLASASAVGLAFLFGACSLIEG